MLGSSRDRIFGYASFQLTSVFRRTLRKRELEVLFITVLLCVCVRLCPRSHRPLHKCRLLAACPRHKITKVSKTDCSQTFHRYSYFPDTRYYSADRLGYLLNIHLVAFIMNSRPRTYFERSLEEKYRPREELRRLSELHSAERQGSPTKMATEDSAKGSLILHE